MDCSPPGSSVHGICQARILEQFAISFSRGSSWPRDRTHISCIGRKILYNWATREAPWRLYQWGNWSPERWILSPVFLLGEFHELRSLVGYRPWGCKESVTTEGLILHFTFTRLNKPMKHKESCFFCTELPYHSGRGLWVHREKSWGLWYVSIYLDLSLHLYFFKFFIEA